MRMSNRLSKEKIEEVKKMSEEELVRQFAPVLYFHEDENWLPTDYFQMVERATLRFNHSKKEVKADSTPFSQLSFDERLNFLRDFPDSDKCHLDLPEVDLDALKARRSGKVRYGLWEVVDAAKRHYSNTPLSGNYEYKGKCYAKTRAFSTKTMDLKKEEEWYGSGSWIIIQYYFFYLFNASTNVHEGDWDSSVTAAVNLDTCGVLVFYYQHHTYWLTRMNTNTRLDTKEWIEHWDEYEIKPGMFASRKPPAFSLSIDETHPVGFVARGAHGIYPTPGTTVFGIDIPFTDDLPFTVDDRSIGICLAPQELIENDDIWHDDLKCPNLYKLDEPELIRDDPSEDKKVSALWYKGNWGERVKNKAGWSGSKGPIWSSAWEAFQKMSNFEDMLYKDYYDWKDRYFKGGIFRSKILQTEHTL